MDSLPIEPEISLTERLKQQIEDVLGKSDVSDKLKDELRKYDDEKNIPFRLVKQIHDIVSESGTVYLHELIDGSSLHIPELQKPTRDPELEARCQRLRAEQDNQRYKDMVRNVDKSKQDYFAPGNEMKELNRQLMSVFNFIITVGGAFAFGYKATEYTFAWSPNVFAFQLMAAMTLATVVFFADLYFLLKEG